MRALFTATLWNILASTFTIAVSIIRLKFLAVLLGPYGFGILVQLNSFLAFLASVPSGLNTGIVKNTAEYYTDDRATLARLLTSVRTTLIIMGLIGMVLSIFFSRKIALYLFADESLHFFIILASLALPFTFMFHTYQSFIQGLKEIPRLALGKIIAAVLSILFVLPMVYFWRLDGAVLHLVVFALISWVVFGIIWRGVRRRRLVAPSASCFDQRIIKRVFEFGIVTTITMSALSLTYLLIRIYISSLLGLEQVGMFQAAFGISTQYIPLVLGSALIYLLPHWSGIKDMAVITHEMNETIRLFLLLMTPMIVVLIGGREIIILALYSKEFLAAAELLKFQLIGDLFRVIIYGLASSLLPTGRLRAFLALSLSWDIVFLALAVVLVPVVGLKGIPISYSAATAIFALLHYFYQRKSIGFRIARSNIRQILYSFIIVLVAMALPKGLAYYLILSIMLVLWALASIKLSEVKKAYYSLTFRLSRSRDQ